MMPLGLAEYDAGQFLVIYAGLVIIGWLLAVIVPKILRPVGQANAPANAGEFAALAGGKARYAEAKMAGHLASGRVSQDGKRFSVRERVAADGGADTRLISIGDRFSWKTFTRTIEGEYQQDRTALINSGLLTAPGSTIPSRLFAILPLMLILALGAYRLRTGQELGEPIGFLAALMVVAVAIIIWRLASGIKRTREGDRVLKLAREEHVGMRRAPTRDQMALGVAIFGTAVLAGTPFDQLHAMRQGGGGADGSYGGDSDSSSDGGGSGCGGGGCGGCGG